MIDLKLTKGILLKQKHKQNNTIYIFNKAKIKKSNNNLIDLVVYLHVQILETIVQKYKS